MALVRIEEDFYQHPKVAQAGPLAMAMQVAALCYCHKYLTDGFLPRAVVPVLLNLEGLAMRVWQGKTMVGVQKVTWQFIVQCLLAAGLWEEAEDGYWIHDYLDYQPSREEVLKQRAYERKRADWNGMRSRIAPIVFERDNFRCVLCGATDDLTVDHIVPLALGGTNDLDNLHTLCRSCNCRKGVHLEVRI